MKNNKSDKETIQEHQQSEVAETEELNKEESPAPKMVKPAKKKKRFSFKKFCAIFVILILLLGLCWSGLFFYFSYTNQFPIKKVSVFGVYQYVEEQDVETALKPYITGKGMFAFSERQAERTLKQLPGVADVTIWRIFPAQIKVVIQEHNAIARFGNGSLLASDGSIFITNNQPDGMKNLPLLQGSPRYAKDMLEMLESLKPVFANMNENVTGLGLAENGDWSVQINNQTWIMLGKNDLQNRLLNFLNAYPVLMKTAAPGATLSYVDLRYNRGFAAAWTGGASGS